MFAKAFVPYAILIIAVLAAAAGKAIVKVPAVLVLLPPKSRAHTALSLFVSL
jgi:hypothetical protein